AENCSFSGTAAGSTSGGAGVVSGVMMTELSAGVLGAASGVVSGDSIAGKQADSARTAVTAVAGSPPIRRAVDMWGSLPKASTRSGKTHSPAPGGVRCRNAAGWVTSSHIGGHVGEVCVVLLEGDRDGVGGPGAVLGDDEVGLAGAVVAVVGVVAVQQDD